MLGLKPEKDASLILAIKEAVKKLGLITLLVNYISCASGMREVAVTKIEFFPHPSSVHRRIIIDSELKLYQLKIYSRP